MGRGAKKKKLALQEQYLSQNKREKKKGKRGKAEEAQKSELSMCARNNSRKRQKINQRGNVIK